jgi:adenylate cyclase
MVVKAGDRASHPAHHGGMTDGSDLSPQRVQEISDWLIEAALVTTDLPTLVDGYCARLAAAGMALRRLTLGSHLMHPTWEAQTVRWTRGGTTSTEAFEVGASAGEVWQRSPIRAAIEAPNSILRRRLEATGVETEFPILAELKADGITDYVGLATPFDAYNRPGMPTGMMVSYATDRRGGFDDDEIAAIERLQPRLAVAVKSAVLIQIAGDVIAAYLGADAGRRVLGGEVDRGAVDVLNAVLFFCDLRGFTALADGMDRHLLIHLLDTYFDAIAGPIADHGGQVLKFMGDGLLATFSLDEGDPTVTCGHALAAATAALAAVAGINAPRRAAGDPIMELDIALHQGEVVYGNVGARDRLDFTVIGPTVNEASRMEQMCDRLGVHLVLSESVVAASGPVAADRFESLGHHPLRGVGAARELFTLKRDGQESG